MTASSLPKPPELLALVRETDLALFLDFDGTLVEIAPTPDSIAVPPDLGSRIAALADRLAGRVALVSGRAITDLERHLGPISVAVAGSHGSDCRAASGESIGDAPSALDGALLEQVERFAQKWGFALEDKPHGTALHYRSAPELEDEGLRFARDIAENHGLQVKRGKCVIELVPRGADKAGAVRAFMATTPFSGTTPVFIGDDVTDEDGMRAAMEFGGFGIVVGERVSENAQFGLESIAAVHHWLKL